MSGYPQRVTADLGQPSLTAAVHVGTLARALLDLSGAGAAVQAGSGESAWSLDLARNLLALAGGSALADPRLVVHDESWEISHAGRVLVLTIAQYRLLRELVRATEHTVLTDHLAQIMFRSSHREQDRVAAHVKRLRRRLVEEDVVGARITAVRGVGYRLTWVD